MVKSYYALRTNTEENENEGEDLPDHDDNHDSDHDRYINRDITAEEPPVNQSIKRGRGRPKESKNKPKSINNADGQFLISKEHADLNLSLKLRKEGKITAAGLSFEESDR